MAQPADSDSGPVGTVFNNAELTEAILLYLKDEEDIIRFRRINKFFTSVVAGSSKLKRKIFAQQSLLKPEDGDGKDINQLNHIVFPHIHIPMGVRGRSPNPYYRFCFRIESDPGFVYKTGRWGKLIIVRMQDTAPSEIKILPDVYLDSFLSTHICAVPVCVSQTLRVYDREFCTPPGTTVRELVFAVKDYFQEREKGNSGKITTLDTWQPVEK